jgi:hypothetical protein
MPKYRLIVTADDAAPEPEVHEFEAKNENEAIQAAKNVLLGRRAELWRSYRVVKRWKAGE